MPALILKPGRERSLLRRHPWVFSGAIAHLEPEPQAGEPGAGDPQPGDTVDILSDKHAWLAKAAYSPASQIRARIWTCDPAEEVNADFFRRRLTACLHTRTTLAPAADATSLRLVHAESDGLPGLVVDRYAQVLVVQFLSAGAEKWRHLLTDLLSELTGCETIYERSDVDVRTLEGLPQRRGLLKGTLPSPLTIHENGLQFILNLETGHKTGFYLDQRQNRLRVRSLAQDRAVLDCFCYTGGFSLNALAGQATSVLSVDTSAEALVLCSQNVALNGLPTERHQLLAGDVFLVLRKFRDEARSFDLVVLDPPKFAPTISQVDKAARAYKDINLLALKLLRPGGLLVTFSCSGGVDILLFQKIVASAAQDANLDVQVLERLTQSSDHPFSLNFPEGEYLKGLICLRK